MLYSNQSGGICLKHRLKIGFIGLTVFVISFLTACSGNGSGTGNNGDGSVTKTTPAEPSEVIFYTNNGTTEELFNSSFGDALRKKFPNYTIKFIGRVGQSNNMPEMVATNTRFDIYYSSIGNFENNMFPYNIQYDMSDLIKKHKVDLTRFEPAIIDGIVKSSGGKLYALPVFTDTLVLYYNKSLFNKFNVPYPKDGMSWDEILELARKLTQVDGGIKYTGLTFIPVYTFFMNPLSIPAVEEATGKPTINTDARWETFFQTLAINPTEISGIRDYYANMKSILEIIDGFQKTETIAMVPYVAGWANSMPDNMDWDMVTLPSFKGQTGISAQPYSYYFGITNMAKDKDAAMEVLNYLVSDEMQTTLAKRGSLPVIKSTDVRNTLGKDSKYKDKHWQAAFANKFAPVPYKGIYEVPVLAIYADYATKVMRGDMDVNTARRLAEEAAIKTLAELKK
jgi:multiple sugar transport system substrate-binding protein